MMYINQLFHLGGVVKAKRLSVEIEHRAENLTNNQLYGNCQGAPVTEKQPDIFLSTSKI